SPNPIQGFGSKAKEKVVSVGQGPTFRSRWLGQWWLGRRHRTTPRVQSRRTCQRRTILRGPSRQQWTSRRRGRLGQPSSSGAGEAAVLRGQDPRCSPK